MDLKRLHYFCTIAEQGQVSRAAKLLHMAQPPLSQRLRELEDELGSALFVRKGRSLQLTAAGDLLYARARQILRTVEVAKEEVVRLASPFGPALRIGLSPTCRSWWLSHFDRVRAAFPERQIGLVVGDSSYLEQLMQSGQLDVAFMQPPQQPENFIVHRLASCRSVAVVPRALLPWQDEALSLSDLGAHPLLLLRRSVGIGSYELLLRRFHDAGLAPNIALYCSDISLLLDLLDNGFRGIAVVPASETGELGEAYQIRAIAVDLPEYHVSMVCRRSEQEGDLLPRLLSVWPGSSQIVAA